MDYIKFILIGLMFVLLLIWMDSYWDTGYCLNEFNQVNLEQNMTVCGVFANNDFWNLNFGQKIQCTIFLKEDKWLTSIDYEIGTLTPEMIENSRYWE